MLSFLRGKTTERKFRLFAVACCLRVRELLSEQERNWVELAEKYAESETGQSKLKAARRNYPAIQGRLPTAAEMAAWAAFSTMRATPWNAAIDASRGVGDAVVIQADQGRAWSDEVHAARADARYEVLLEHASLLRHIIGNPLCPFQTPSSWPSSVTSLAQALYNQEPCHFALHDALLDCGQQELAEHFKQEGHPKGCWALDAILGKS
jgi:hypothetical protein